MTFMTFPSYYVIIPTDELTFFRGVGIPPTTYIYIFVCIFHMEKYLRYIANMYPKKSLLILDGPSLQMASYSVLIYLQMLFLFSARVFDESGK